MQVLGSRNAKYSLSAMPTPAMGRVRAAQPGSPLSVQPRTAPQLALTPSDGTDSWRPGPGVRSPHSVSQAPVRRSRRAPQQTASEASLPSIAEEEQHATADALLELASDPSHVSSLLFHVYNWHSTVSGQLIIFCHSPGVQLPVSVRFIRITGFGCEGLLFQLCSMETTCVHCLSHSWL